jgi:hypothetical protein
MHWLSFLLMLILTAVTADQCDKYSPEAAMFRLLIQDDIADAGLFSTQATLIDTARAAGDRDACIRAWDSILEQLETGEVVNGKIILYHGNIMGSNNLEIHGLRRPNLIYSARTMDWRNGLANGETPLDLRITIGIGGVEVKIVDDSLSAPVEYVFQIAIPDN